MFKLVTLFVSLSLCLTMTASAAVQTGGSDGSGGNTEKAEFYTLARAFAHYMDLIGGKANIKNPTEGYKKFVASIKVIPVEGPLTLNGEKVDAINYAQTRIILLDDSTWSKRSRAKKYQNVIHEILGLLSTPDPNDELSEKLATESFGFINQSQSQQDSQEPEMPPKAPIIFAKKIDNFDGSVTIKSPKLMIQDKYRMVVAEENVYRINCIEGADAHLSTKKFDTSIAGLCALFGKTTATTLSTIEIENSSTYTSRNPNPKIGFSHILLNSDGSFAQIKSPRTHDLLNCQRPLADVLIGQRKNALNYSKLKLIETITCK